MSNSFHISLPDGSYYDALAEDNLLTAAQRAHWLVRYGCRNGNCLACAAELIQGHVQHRDGHIIAAPTAEILLCLCKPLSDLLIALTDDPRPGSVAQSSRSYARLERQVIASDHSRLTFMLPAGRKPALLGNQIALIETDAGLLQAQIDSTQSHERTLILTLQFPSPLHEGAYYHVRYPLSAT